MGAGVTPRFVFILVLALAGFSVSARAQASEGTHSPHGSLAIPCQNCHTANGWKPIRAVPEFDHNQTRYPLRGMHSAVACTSCHVKMVFSNVGQRCQDCHADIHKRQLGANCEQCHTVRGWQVAIKDIEAHNNRFPLTGAHAAVDCDACHKSGANSKFQTMSTACYSCHQSDFTTTNNPSHVKAKFPVTCESCHSTDNWLNVNLSGFDHSTTGFILSGGHAVPPRQCADCHVNNNYTLGALPCVGCHQKDFDSASTPVPHTGFPTTCEQCHDTVQWTDGKFDHSTTGFTLTGMHTVPPRACTDCHVNNNYTLSSTACVTCHLKDFQGTTNPNHATSGFAQTCEQCHGTADWTNVTFNHNLTKFPLTGMHTVPPRQCSDCHANNNYNLSGTTCVTCHLKDFQGTTSPAHVTANFPQTCEQCHDTNNWTDSTFNHSNTGFALTGMHTVPPRLCSDCHVNNNYALNQTSCYGCHQKDFQGTTNPSHVSLNFATTCDTCHTTAGWSPANFDHNTVNFALTGMHTVPPRACTDCHVNNNYQLTTNTCVSCHLTDFNNTNNPNHVAQGFAQTCQTCHNTSAWQPAQFDHAKSGFPLTGTHATTPCASCHINNNYNITDTSCYSCHSDVYKTTTAPPHATANFPTTCQTCHDTVVWTDSTWNHTSTGFALQGQGHSMPPRLCTDCHNPQFGNYNITSGACVNCHLKDYQGTTSPNHVTASFPQTCEQCHDTNTWTNSTWTHDSTGWPLTNNHKVPPRACTDCHVNNNYTLNSTLCYSCHQKDYSGTNSPPHAASGFSTTCETCHDTNLWTDATFNHNNTPFPLTGTHTTTPCASCHVNNNYTSLPTNCDGCHDSAYQTAITPVNHPAAGFPTTCQTCHDTVVWTDGKFDHSTTGWQLTSNHQVPPRLCTDCHVNNNYALNSTLCYTCHQKDYAGTNSPPHASVGFPTTCEVCHDTNLWTDATFNHNNTPFPLTGTHTTTPCASCHVNNNYTSLPTNCDGCHDSAYQTATTPVNHPAAAFPTTCQTCHDTVLWTDGKFDHTTTGFPLTYNHQVPPRLCTDCHVNNNYSLNSTLCYSCHQKDYAGTTNPAHAAAGFPTTCEVCHDTNLWTDSTFNHNNTGFPLVGMHTVPPRACTDCHVNNNYNLTSNACSACHQTDYNGTTNPAHSSGANAAFFPIAQCGTCHSVSASGWTGATFNHTQYTQFSINHGNANGQCATCHINGGDYSVFQCTGCHGNNNPNNFQHDPVNGYVYNSINCYQCHASGNGG